MTAGELEISRVPRGVNILLLGAAGAFALELIEHGAPAVPVAQAVATAAAHWGIDPHLLLALAKHESNLNPTAQHTNTNGTVDRGLIQINDTIARHYGVHVDALFDPAVNASVAGHLLSDLKRELGNKLTVFTLISAYNVGSPTVLKKGIVNWPYVSAVYAHYTLYGISSHA